MMWASMLSARMTCITLMRCHSVHEPLVPAGAQHLSACVIIAPSAEMHTSAEADTDPKAGYSVMSLTSVIIVTLEWQNEGQRGMLR